MGVTFDNMNQKYNDFAFGTGFGMLIFDIFLYTFVGWYLHRVLPREWGVVSECVCVCVCVHVCVCMCDVCMCVDKLGSCQAGC